MDEMIQRKQEKKLDWNWKGFLRFWPRVCLYVSFSLSFFRSFFLSVCVCVCVCVGFFHVRPRNEGHKWAKDFRFDLFASGSYLDIDGQRQRQRPAR